MNEAKANDGTGRGVIAVRTAAPLLLATLTLFLLITFDTHLLRVYRLINWPHWSYPLEEFLSDGGYWLFLFMGAGLLTIRGKGRGFIEAAGGFAIQFALVHGLKPLFGRVRPCHGGEAWLFTGPSAIHSSFPSGHTTAAWTMAFLLIRRYPRGWPLWVAGASLISWARIHADAHFFGDVAAGIIVAWTAERLVHALTAERGDEDSAPPHSPRPSMRGRFVKISRPIVGLLPVIVVGVIGIGLSPSIPEYSQAKARETVARMYRQVLGREADGPGLDVFTEQLAGDSLTISIMREMALSPEFIGQLKLLTPEERASRMYHRLLGRDPMPMERQVAEAILDVPETGLRFAVRTLVFRMFLSREYLERFGCFTIPIED